MSGELFMVRKFGDDHRGPYVLHNFCMAKVQNGIIQNNLHPSPGAVKDYVNIAKFSEDFLMKVEYMAMTPRNTKKSVIVSYYDGPSNLACPTLLTEDLNELLKIWDRDGMIDGHTFLTKEGQVVWIPSYIEKKHLFKVDPVDLKPSRLTLRTSRE